MSPSYDIIIVGAGVAGSALAHALSTIPRPKPLRIGLIERSLSEPDRIVGEFLQPGGVIALKHLGIESCLEGIDAIKMKGYAVVKDGKSIHIPYPAPYEGRGFHHGRFVMKLREAAARASGVEIIEATVTDLVQVNSSRRITGVTVSRKVDGQDYKESLFADLVIIADGSFSNFRNVVMGAAAVKPIMKSYAIGAILEDARIPFPNHGVAIFLKGFGPVFLFQRSEHETRISFYLKQPLPSDLKSHILENIVPQLPSALHLPIQNALEKKRLRRMPDSFLPPIEQGTATTKEGVILLGDSWNMRHSITGGGMTVALNDVVILRDLLGSVKDWKDWKQIQKALHRWHWDRKPVASIINIFSVALYDLFGADDKGIDVLKTGCFKYAELGGQHVNELGSLLAGIAPSPSLAAYYFFSVAFRAIWVMFTHPPIIPSSRNDKSNGSRSTIPQFFQYPVLTIRCVRALWTTCMEIAPLLWTEIRWWSASDPSQRINFLVLLSVIPVVLLFVVVTYRLLNVGIL